VDHIDFLVEEPSTEAALRVLLPRIIGETSFEIYQFQCKQNLLSKLPNRLRGYASWLPDNYKVIVLVDKDDDDCRQLKLQLEEIIREAGLASRRNGLGNGYQVVSRIAIEELEAWFFGDWSAVCRSYPGVSSRVPEKDGFRDSDSILGGTWEALERHLKKGGHFKTGLRKIEAARAIAENMSPESNSSRSFQMFRDTLTELISLE
jgi:hypothetical protein